MKKREYKNPIAKQGDFADPFVLRYNGKYYLYATNPDIRCFSSDNLVDFKLEGPVIEEGTFGDLVPFAPEVLYHDGKFYMYTSPSGFGHYVLESDAPTGPFRIISPNVEHSIDGSVFIDDDGKWYFYWAGDEGIWGCEMLSPTEFGEPVLTGANLHGWTEGPLIVKRDRIYYMTYTGNHYLSNGYRIQAAWSKKPLTGYQDDLYNPVMVHTEGEGVGLGHSSTVVGPNLVSNYIVYHNLNEDTTRDLNIDRILWHKESTQILGPTRTNQPSPSLPEASFPALYEGKELIWEIKKGSFQKEGEFYRSAEGEFLIQTKENLQENFTAEMNLIPQECKGCGIRLAVEEDICYTLEFGDNPSKIYVNRMEGCVKELVKEISIEGSRLNDALHCITVRQYKGELFLSFDGRSEVSLAVREPISSIGYFSEGIPLVFGYTAVTNTVWEEEERDVFIPSECSFSPIYGKGETVSDEKGRVMLEKGEKREYRIGLCDAGSYVLYVSLKQQENTRFQVSIDGEIIKECSSERGLQKIEFDVEEGEHTLVLEGKTGRIVLNRLEITKNESLMNEIEKENLSVTGYGKSLLSEMAGDDYVIEAVLSLEDIKEKGSAGILLRVTEPSEGGEGEDSVLGIDFFRGYSVTFTKTALKVSKHCYDRTLLGEIPYSINEHDEYHLFIEMKGDTILVKNSDQKEILKVTDEYPLTRGCAGVWAENSKISVKKIGYINIEERE